MPYQKNLEPEECDAQGETFPMEPCIRCPLHKCQAQVTHIPSLSSCGSLC